MRGRLVLWPIGAVLVLCGWVVLSGIVGSGAGLPAIVAAFIGLAMIAASTWPSDGKWGTPFLKFGGTVLCLALVTGIASQCLVDFRSGQESAYIVVYVPIFLLSVLGFLTTLIGALMRISRV